MLKDQQIKIPLLEDVKTMTVKQIKPSVFKKEVCKENLRYFKKIQNILRNEQKRGNVIK